MSFRFNTLQITIISFLLFSYMGCGGGGGGGETPKKSISGYAIDAPIAGAIMSLDCGSGIIRGTNPVSKEDGSFTIDTIDIDQDLTQCTIIAGGGNDGDDLNNIIGGLKTPYTLYNKQEDIIVTPFTTLISNELDNGSTLENAKEIVANFLDINVSDITSNPMNNVELAKKAKILTKLALIQKENSTTLGMPTEIKNTTLDNYINTLSTSSGISTQTLNDFKAEKELIESTTNAKDIRKQSIIGTTLTLLKDAYKQTSYTDQQQSNLKTLATAIAKANSINGTYQTITKNHIRKALSDVELLPNFIEVTDANGTQNVLTDTLKNTLSSTSFTFASNDINITNVDSIIVFDSNTYKKILKDDQNARREYYAFSDKSNIAKALKLTQNSYGDDVNDPVNVQIAYGLANLGFNDEAMEQLETNVYDTDQRFYAYRWIGEALIIIDKKTIASTYFKKQFQMQKNSFEAQKKSYEALGTIPEKLKNIAENFAKANDTTGTDDIVKYLENDLLPVVVNNASTIPYGSATYYYTQGLGALELISQYLFLSGLEDKAKEYASKGAKLAVNDPGSIPYGTIAWDANIFANRMAINAAIFGEIEAGKLAYEKGLTYLESNGTKRNLDSNDEPLPFVARALLGEIDMNETIKTLDNFSEVGTKNMAIRRGVGAYLYVNGQEDRLFSYYDNFPLGGYDTPLYDEINFGVENELHTAVGIKALGGNEKLKTYLTRMRSYISKRVSSDEEKKNYYGYWGNEENYKWGVLGIAKIYSDLLGDKDLALDTIKECIAKIKTMTAGGEKLESLKNIIYAMHDLKLEDTSTLKEITDTLYETAMSDKIDKDNIISIETSFIKTAKILYVYNEKNNASQVAKKAYDLTPKISVSFNADSVTYMKQMNNKIKYLLGTGSGYKNSVADIYRQMNDTKKVKKIIQECNEAIDALDETAQKYEKLVPIAVTYGSIMDLTNVKKVIEMIKTTKEKNNALKYTAAALSNYATDQETFIEEGVYPIYQIDSDHDEKPDFFNIGITQEQISSSEIALDDDIDGDGTADDIDELPYDNVK